MVFSPILQVLVSLRRGTCMGLLGRPLSCPTHARVDDGFRGRARMNHDPQLSACTVCSATLSYDGREFYLRIYGADADADANSDSGYLAAPGYCETETPKAMGRLWAFRLTMIR
jgi:hypothetical protein